MSAGAQSDAPLPFQFNGSGGEYFKIWIVNLCLTILTLGIYSAWAKVRRNRYFYGNTQVAGSGFDYVANPVSILKGRLIAVAFFIGLSVSQHISMTVYGVLLLVFLVLLPWLIVRSMAFRARNTAWRNIRFGFDGTYGQAFTIFFLLPLVPLALMIAPTLYVVPDNPASIGRLLVPMGIGMLLMTAMAPYLLYRQKRWLVEHSGFGGDRFYFDGAALDFYKIFGVMLLILIGIVVAVSVLAGVGAAGVILGGAAGGETGPQGALGASFFGLMMVVYGLFLLGYTFMFAYFKARTANIVYGGSSIEGHGFMADLSAWGLFKVYLVNILAIIFTLGLFIPWAKVRTARYTADHLWLVPNGDLDRFVAVQQQNVSAMGEEMGEMFDIDIGL
jgi:uncharacterized membrane protein YjgN (DUF898 family)